MKMHKNFVTTRIKKKEKHTLLMAIKSVFGAKKKETDRGERS